MPARTEPHAAVCDASTQNGIGLRRIFKNDLLAGFLGLLIALPLVFVGMGSSLLAGVVVAIFLIGLVLLYRLFQGVPFTSLWKPYLAMTEDSDNTCMISADQSAIFARWNSFRKSIEKIGLRQHRNVVIDLTKVDPLDHDVMTKLVDLQRDFKRQGLRLDLAGLNDHLQCSEQSRLTRTIVLNKN